MYLHFYVLVNIFVKYLAEVISGNVCLDRTLSFATEYSVKYWGSCNGFPESSIQDFVNGGTNACHTKCQINLKYESKNWNKLVVLSMVFDSYNITSRTTCVARLNEAQLLVNCSNLRKEQLGIFFNSDCRETNNAECSKWNNFCVCHCHPGYIMQYGHCIQARKNDNLAAAQLENNENIGGILGALFGGLLLGFIITTGIGFIMHRRFRLIIQKRTDQKLMHSKNKTCNRTIDTDITQQDKQRQVLNVPPLTRSEQSPEYSNTSGQQNTVTVTDDVYNHLNEEEETQDGDTYDHACAATKKVQAIEFGDYCNHQGLNDDYNLSAGTTTDDYSTLEHI